MALPSTAAKRQFSWARLIGIGAIVIAVPLAAMGLMRGAVGAEEAVVIPAPAKALAVSGSGLQTAVFAGGCFWGVQGVFQHMTGVKSAVSGYAGGEAQTAIYEVVGSGQTGHAEAVEIVYDPAEVSYEDLIQVYFSVAHNPTQLNYQGPDYGTQYRSTIFFASAAEQDVAAAYIAQLDATGAFDAPIVTTLEPLTKFYPAEDYHQDFLTLNPTYPYIVYNDLPKIVNLERIFPELYRAQPVLVASAK